MLPGLSLVSMLPLRTFSSDFSSPYRFPYLCLTFFWYFRICWAANSKMLASGSPFLQMAVRKYSQASRIPDCSNTPTESQNAYCVAGPQASPAPSCAPLRAAFPSRAPSLCFWSPFSPLLSYCSYQFYALPHQYISMLVVDQAKRQGPFGRFQRAVSILTTFMYQFQYYFTVGFSIYSAITGWWTFLAVMGTIMIITIPLKRNQFFIRVVNKYLMPCKHFEKFEIIHEQLIPNQELNVFGVHPHSVYSIGLLGSMNSSGKGPLSRMVGLGSRFLMNCPIAGALLRLWGLETVEPSNVKRLMRARKNIGLIPGGFQEATITSPHEMRIWIENRKGFIKYSIEHGYTIRPVLTLNEHQAFSTFEPWMKFRLALNRLKFPAVLYINKLTLFFLPPWTKIHVIVGKGIREPLKEGQKVSQEMIDRAHRNYANEILRIYEKYRGLNGDKPIRMF